MQAVANLKSDAVADDGPQGISIASGPSLEFGMGSFSVMGWAKFEDYAYPRTSFVAKNGHGCYFHRASEHSSGIARAGWNPGWEIGHGFNAEGSDVCIRDSADQKARAGIRYDAGSRPLDLQGQWAHYAFVFDRTLEDRFFEHEVGRPGLVEGCGLCNVFCMFNRNLC